MRIRIRQVSVPLQYDDDTLRKRVSRKVGCSPARLTEVHVTRRSLDTRPHHPEPLYVLTVEAVLNEDCLPAGFHQRADIQVLREGSGTAAPPRRQVANPSALRPVVVGSGPAGLLAAYRLALAGARPILIERGDEVGARAPAVARFWQDGALDPESNALFGEGGAGLFSDGKLTARSKERELVREFMRLLHTCGADESVLIDAEPHLGSDVLLTVVPRLREHILANGGEVRFRSRLEGLTIEDGQLRAIRVNGEDMACRHCVLAVGHSARDVYEMLAAAGVALEAKPFAVGVRLELPQAVVDRAQYGRFAGHPLLGPASFRLTRRAEGDLRACYSFCMCPGGVVIGCAAEPGMLTTNGMSYSRRARPNGNAAFLVPVGRDDYPAHAVPALGGIAFQREIERRAFAAGGGNYALPAARLADFLAGTVSATLPDDRSCRRSVPADLRAILPAHVGHTLAGVIPVMLRELKGVALDEGMLYAAETRSSSPLRIVRNAFGEAVSTRGLFPAGEGAGYAGGIVSSALDGMHAAEHVLNVYAA